MRISDILMPQTVKCIFCGREDNSIGICEKCYKELPFIHGRTCNKCGGHVKMDEIICLQCRNYEHIFNTNYSILDYDGIIKDKIIEFKQSRFKDIGSAFAHIMLDYFEKLKLDIDLIIPVPIHENRLKARGFNQTEILLTEIAKKYNKLVNPELLKRIKDTPHQTGLGRINRLENLYMAFEVTNKKKIKNKKILLVDDIYTTGTTLDECARTLYDAGAKSVMSLCLARGLVYDNKK